MFISAVLRSSRLLNSDSAALVGGPDVSLRSEVNRSILAPEEESEELNEACTWPCWTRYSRNLSICGSSNGRYEVISEMGIALKILPKLMTACFRYANSTWFIKLPLLSCILVYEPWIRFQKLMIAGRGDSHDSKQISSAQLL